MPTEKRTNETDTWISCDDGIHLILMDESSEHYGWVFREVKGSWPYSVRKATEHEMAHAKARQHLRTGVSQLIVESQPAPQPHVEPIAWMVGTAFWWTKEEAERDAAASGLSMIPFGPLTGSAEVEQLREVIKRSDAQIMRQSMRISNQRAQLAKQEALLRELIQIAEDREQGYSDRLHGGVVNGKAADSLVMLMGRMKLAVSSDAGPSAAAEHQP